MKRSRIALVGLAIVLVLLAGLFAWQASVLADPLAAPQGSNPNAPLATPQPLSSYQRIQNLDPVAVSTMTVTVYSTAGVVQGSAITSSNPYRSALVDERSCCGVGSGFAGSGVVNATTDIAAVTFLVSSGAGGSTFRSDAYSAVPGPGVSNGPQLFPIVQKGVVYKQQTITSTIALQNAGASSSDFYVTFFPRANPLSCAGLNPGTSVLFTQTSVAPNATAYVNFASTGNSTLDNCGRLNGAVSVTSTQPFASVIATTSDNGLYANTAWIPAAGPSPVDSGTQVRIPLVQKYNSFSGEYLSTGMSFQTEDNSTQTITLTLIANNASGGGCAPGTIITATRILNPGAGFNMTNAAEMVCSFFFGSALVQSPVPIVASYQTEASPDNTGACNCYDGVTQAKGFPNGVGSTALYAPHVVRNKQYPTADGLIWSASGIAINANMPLGNTFSGQVFCNFYIDAGWNDNPANSPAVLQYTRSINNTTPRAGCNTQNPEFTSSGYITLTGSAYVTSTNGILIVANVQQNGVGAGQGDTQMTYRTVNR